MRHKNLLLLFLVLLLNSARGGTADEECNINSCEDDTTSESDSSDSVGENTYLKESLEVLFVPEEDIQHVN